MPISQSQFIDIVRRIIQEKYSRPLRTSEIAALSAAWADQKYEEYINEQELDLATSSLKQAAYFIYPSIREALNIPKLRKSNIRAELSRKFQAGELTDYLKESPSRGSRQGKIYGQLSQAKSFSGRTDELNQLKRFYRSKKIIYIWGESGIGKSALIAEFCHGLSGSIILASRLREKQSQTEWAYECLQILGEPVSEDAEQQLKETLIQEKITLIVDGLECNPSLYSEFIEPLLSTPSNSTVLIASTILFPQIHHSEEIERIHLDKIQDFKTFFRHLDLQESKKWIDLYEKYNGNPGQLIHAANIINKFFNASVDDFINQSSTVFSEEAYQKINKEELTSIDIRILKLLSDSEPLSPVNIYKQLMKEENFSSELFFQRFNHLENSSLIIKVKDKFSVSPLIKRWIQKELVE